MYACTCGCTFTIPKTVYDDVNDEQYDGCPQCGSDSYDTIEEEEHHIDSVTILAMNEQPSLKDQLSYILKP